MVPIPELDRDMKITIRIESFSYDLSPEHFVCLESNSIDLLHNATWALPYKCRGIKSSARLLSLYTGWYIFSPLLPRGQVNAIT